jgi:hypothetical protein
LLVLDHLSGLRNDGFFGWIHWWRLLTFGGYEVAPRLTGFDHGVSMLAVWVYFANLEQHYYPLLFAVGGLHCQNWRAVILNVCESCARGYSMGPCVDDVFSCKPLQYAP